jgi:hypothetical protein
MPIDLLMNRPAAARELDCRVKSQLADWAGCPKCGRPHPFAELRWLRESKLGVDCEWCAGLALRQPQFWDLPAHVVLIGALSRALLHGAANSLAHGLLNPLANEGHGRPRMTCSKRRLFK